MDLYRLVQRQRVSVRDLRHGSHRKSTLGGAPDHDRTENGGEGPVRPARV